MSCGKTTGHGESCVDGHECDECTIIRHLEVDNARLRKALEEADAKFDYTAPEISHHIIKQAKTEDRIEAVRFAGFQKLENIFHFKPVRIGRNLDSAE